MGREKPTNAEFFSTNAGKNPTNAEKNPVNARFYHAGVICKQIPQELVFYKTIHYIRKSQQFKSDSYESTTFYYVFIRVVWMYSI